MKTAIVTGASRGIGKEVALKLKKEGYNVVGSYLNSLSSANELEKLGIDMLKCDVSRVDDIDALFCYAEKKYNKVDLVIANAGVAIEQKPLLDVGENEIDSLLQTNVKGVLLTDKRAVASMILNGGVILNVSSVWGLIGGSCEVAYSASKHAVIGITKALAEELSCSDIKVLAVAPGLIDTDMNAHLSSEDKMEFIKACNLDKIPKASDVADEIIKILGGCDLNGKIIPLFTGNLLDL